MRSMLLFWSWITRAVTRAAAPLGLVARGGAQLAPAAESPAGCSPSSPPVTAPGPGVAKAKPRRARLERGDIVDIIESDEYAVVQVVDQGIAWCAFVDVRIHEGPHGSRLVVAGRRTPAWPYELGRLRLVDRNWNMQVS